MSGGSLIAGGVLEPESESVEYKESWQDEYLKSLAAFANTRGGTLRVGVRDNGTVNGWTGDGRDQEGITNKILSVLGVHPFRMEVEQCEGRPVLAIEMLRAAAPVNVRGRFYRRVGNTTREVPEAELVRFLLEHTGKNWDELPSEASVSDLSVGAIEAFKVLSRERLPAIGSTDPLDVLLRKLRLLAPDGSIKRGAYLLFGAEPETLFRSAVVQVGNFGGPTIILDERIVRGNLFDQLNETMHALRKYLMVRYDIPGAASGPSSGRSAVQDMQRIETWEIPFDAIREAVLKALIHRDYTVNGAIMIRVFADRMTISNPGGLMEGLTVADLLKESHDSVHRNPILAEMVYYTKLIERWGTGTIRMRDACRSAKVADPEFEAGPSNFTITFHRAVVEPRKNADSLLPIAAAVLELAELQKRVTTKMCVERLGMSRARAWRLLNDLSQQGYLRPHGKGRTRFYVPA